MPLTNTAIRNAKPGSKPTRLFDERGLYLEVSPTGGKWWRLKFRFEGKEKRLSLGVYPDVPMKDARDRRDTARKLLADGIDPSENRKAQKLARADSAANSFEVVAREWLSKYSTIWAANHGDRIIRRFERDIFPWIGGRPIAEITAPEVLTLVRRIESRGALETAHRTLSNCGQVFRYPIATGRAKHDPSGDLRGALPPVRVRIWQQRQIRKRLLRCCVQWMTTKVPLRCVAPYGLRHWYLYAQANCVRLSGQTLTLMRQTGASP
jgi:Phage integrase central domain/Arm DNA-binding domain